MTPIAWGDLCSGLDRGWGGSERHPAAGRREGVLEFAERPAPTADAVNAVSPTYAQELKNPLLCSPDGGHFDPVRL